MNYLDITRKETHMFLFFKLKSKSKSNVIFVDSVNNIYSVNEVNNAKMEVRMTVENHLSYAGKK